MNLELSRCQATGCGVLTVSKWSWQRLTPIARARIAAEQGEPVKARVTAELCTAHYGRLRRTGDPLGIVARSTPRKPRGALERKREDVLEEWSWLVSDGVREIAVAAPRMGMSVSALEQALYRARRDGDARGNIPVMATNEAPGRIRHTNHRRAA